MQIVSIFAPFYCLAVSYFASLSLREWDFRKKKCIWQSMCFDLFYNFYL